MQRNLSLRWSAHGLLITLAPHAANSRHPTFSPALSASLRECLASGALQGTVHACLCAQGWSTLMS